MRYQSLWLFVVGLCMAHPPISQAQPACTRLPLLYPPASVTPLLRAGTAAGYLNEIVPADQAAELHLIGSYSGAGRIVIGPTDKPVVLALGSLKPSVWRIELQSGARLQKIIVFGGDEQRVSGASADVEIVSSSCPVWAYDWDRVRETVRYMSSEYRIFLAAAQQESGLAETSFQGGYDAGTYFSIPPSRTDYTRGPAPVPDPSEVRILLSPTPTEAIARYEAAMDRAPAEFRPTMKILIDLMKDHKLPTLFPNGGINPDPGAPVGPRYLFNPEAAPGTVQSGSNCKGFYFAGQADGGNLECGFGNQFFVLGTANKVLDDGWGDDIVDPGRGDHVLHLGWGNDIVVLQEGWGDDIITKTCHNSVLATNDRNRLNWPFQFTNFIVFGPGIKPSDVHWEIKGTLVHEPSKSRLTINDQCFNFVFTEEGELRPYQPPPKPAAMSNEHRSPTSDKPGDVAR
jgi:hypothetical protein